MNVVGLFFIILKIYSMIVLGIYILFIIYLSLSIYKLFSMKRINDLTQFKFYLIRSTEHLKDGSMWKIGK